MATEFAWLIEKGPVSEPSYYAPTVPGEWTRDHLKACRFARKEDAEAIQFRHVSNGHLPVYDTRICEHGWHDVPRPDLDDQFGKRLHKLLSDAAERINAAR